MAREDKPVIDVDDRYRPRIIDKRIDDILSTFGGMLIVGPKWCGKSWTGMRHSKSALLVGDEDSALLAALDPESALDGNPPRLVDEWQDVPKLWDVARRNIDLSGKRGLYIFTGSTIPPKDATHHTGTGRFATVRMHPMSLFESGDSSGVVSLSRLFDTGKVDVIRSNIEYKEAVRLICRGGWPAAIGMSDREAADVSRMYVKSVSDSNMSGIDGKKRNKKTMQLVLRSLARNNATLVKPSVIAADMSEGGTVVSDGTVRDYINALKSIYMIEEQEAWAPSLRSRSRVRTSPKIHFSDPSLAVALLRAAPDILMKEVRTAGFLFESLCYRDLCVYASALDGDVYHYRDNTGLEVDEIIELGDGRWGAVEVKLGTFEFDKAADSLLSLKEKAGEAREPSFLMILCASGGLAYTREDGVAVVPIDLLGP
ncbi:MAG: DUF4143 domain-containing protein [Candidatus Methanoplasma sp.]|nr:DUF4143 domain-containing protein [Candidatus Methanoplasma sp.]